MKNEKRGNSKAISNAVQDAENQAKRRKTDSESEQHQEQHGLEVFEANEKQVLYDAARSLGFWDFLKQFGPIYGLKSLICLFSDNGVNFEKNKCVAAAVENCKEAIVAPDASVKEKAAIGVVENDDLQVNFIDDGESDQVAGPTTTTAIIKEEIQEEEENVENLLLVLKQAFYSKIAKRTRLDHYQTFEDAVGLIEKSRNIMVLTGAGVSVSCGIPDFRSTGGIYSRLSEFQLSDPQEMFDLEYFSFKPETFYSFAKEIYPGAYNPSRSHEFIKMLQDRGKLLRNYTQNIDTLEQKAGITRVVNCHGSFANATCLLCKQTFEGSFIEAEIMAGVVPYCPRCKEGVIKPDIVFFGEQLPALFHSQFDSDRQKVDLLLVMGSSLKVAPVANIMDRIPVHVPQILVNMECLAHMQRFDIHLLGYSDVITGALADALGYTTRTPRIKAMVPGGVPWQWLFEGARLKSVQDEEEGQDDQQDETESELTEDSNTVSESGSAAAVVDIETGHDESQPHNQD